MSRIPPPSRTAKASIKDETKNSATFKIPPSKVGVKRPGDVQLTQAEKRQRLVGGRTTSTERLPFSGRTGVGARNASSENVGIAPRNAGFSERAKRAALQPISESNLVRGSMPALSAARNGKSKRPAWDLKGRMQDMEQHFLEFKTREQSSTERIAALEAANSILNKDVEIKESISAEATSQASKLQKELNDKTEAMKKMETDKNNEINQLNSANTKLTNDFNTLKFEFDNLQNLYNQETTALKTTIAGLTFSKAGLQAQFDASELLMQNLRDQLRSVTQAKEAKEEECESQKILIANLESKLQNEETTRRQLHNTIQELKGNIRVYCRMRPPLPVEVKNNMHTVSVSISPDQKSMEISPNPDASLADSTSKGKKYDFNFDSIFSSETSQQQVFEEISQLVQSSIDGYNVCIFAYGQTGSGKSYTMEGSEHIVDFMAGECRANLGMIPRSVLQIFECIRKLESNGWKYNVEAFFLEIYNERIRNLLNSDPQTTANKCGIVKSGSKGGDTVLSNVVGSAVTSAEQVFQLLKRARHNRVVASTKCNEHSSRSHYIFQLKISGKNDMTGEDSDGILNLVDLAGSERVKDSGSEGDRLTEAKAINKSLSTLGNVIMALARKESHIPYRDSKLTLLLANSLGGNSKTLMFVNISPDNDNFSESVNSLRFATKVNQCNIGTAQRRVK